MNAARYTGLAALLFLSLASLAAAVADQPLADADRHTLVRGNTNTHTLVYEPNQYLEVYLVPGTDPLELKLSGSFRVGGAEHSELTFSATEEYGAFAYFVVRTHESPLTLSVWSKDAVLPTTGYLLRVNHTDGDDEHVRRGTRATSSANIPAPTHEQLATEWEQSGDRYLAMRHWFLAGTGSFFANEFADSERALRRALDLAVSLDDRQAIAWIYRWIAVLEKIRGDRDAALASLCKGLRAISLQEEESCLPPASDARFTSTRAALVLINEIGLVHHIREEGREAQQWYQAVLDIIAAAYPWEHQFAVTSNNFGGLEYQRGNYELARQRFQASYDSHRRRGAVENQMNMLSNLALVDQKTGDLHRAIDYYTQAIRISESLDLRIPRGYVMHRLGTLHRRIGRLPRAEQLARQSLQLFQSARDAQGILNAQLLLGNILQESARYEDARDVLAEALSSALDLEDNGGIIEAWTQLAETALGEGHFEQALPFAKQARELATEKELIVELPAIMNLQARIFESAGNGDAAESLFRQARQLGESAPGDFVSSSIGLARVLNNRNPNEALGIILDARTTLSMWRQGAGDPFLDAEIVQKASELVEQEVQANLALFEETGDARYVTSALRASDSGQSQVLDSLQRTSLVSNDKTGQITSEIAALVTRRISEGTDEFDPRLERLQLELDAAASLSSLRRVPDQDIWRVPDMRQGEAVLVFQVLEPRSIAWLISADGIAWTALPGREELHRLVTTAYTAFHSLNSRSGDLEPLSAALLSGFSGSLEYEVLYVVPDELLHVVPFAALPKPGSGDPLMETMVVSNIPNLKWLGDTSMAPMDSGSVLAVGDPLYIQNDQAGDGFSGLKPLPWSKVEIAAISEQFSKTGVAALQGENATRTALLNEPLDSYSIIHVATHGIVDQRFPELSGIVMSTTIDGVSPVNGFISAREIAALNVGADLVVLSACETGLGRTLAGEGPLSLSWSFLAAGARQVVSSLWAVSDKSTSDLMVEFYRQLAEERLPAAQALREAQLKLKRDPRTRSPFFWAAFIITGKPITRNERQARLTG